MKDKINEVVGKEGTIWAGGLKVGVTITDYKISYGRERYQVTPISGSGSVWIESVTID